MRIAATLFAAFAAFAASAPLHAQTVTLAADEWCPYNCVAGSARPGYMVEIAQRIFAKQGVKVEYVVMPWSRALAEAAAGRVDGVLGATRSEFKEGVFPTAGQGASVNALATLASAPVKYESVETLKKLRLGAVKDYSYDGGAIDAYLASADAAGKVDLLSGSGVQEQNLRKLLGGRIDAWLENKNVVLWTAAAATPKPDLAVTAVGDADPVFIAFSAAKPDAAKWAAAIDAGVAELRKSGELAQILAAYNLADWE